MSSYLIHLAILVLLYTFLAQSFNVPFGIGRLFNLAHIAAYAIGAYTAAILSTEYEFPFWACAVLATLISGLFAISIGAISLRLAHDYFAVGTLAFSSVVSALLVNWKSLTRGVLGIPGIPRPMLFGFDFSENEDFLLLIGVTALMVQLFFYFLMKSSFGRSLRAQAEFNLGAQALGRDTRLLRNLSFCLSSAVAGLAGAFFAFYLNFIDPSSFGLSEMVFVVTIVIVGSPGSFWGVLAACAFLVLLPEPLRFLEIDSSILGPMRQLLHALILFGVVYWKRATIFPVQRVI